MKVSYSQKQNEQPKIKYYIRPINICIKYNPPILGLIYETVGGSGCSKQYMHKFKLQIDPETNIDLLFEDLRSKTPYYFNPKYIDYSQVINLLNSMKLFCIRSKEALNSFSSVTEKNKHIQSNDGNLQHYYSLENSLQFLYTTPDDKNLSIFDVCTDEKESKKAILPVKPKINSESLINSEVEIKFDESKMKCDNFQETLSKLKSRYRYIDHSIFRNKSYELEINSQDNNSNNSRNHLNFNSLSPKGQSFCINLDQELHMNPFRTRFKKKFQNLLSDNNDYKESNIYIKNKTLKPSVDLTFFNDMEEVYVDDLKMKCWMDKNKNLFDGNLKFLGQAE